MRKRVYTRPCFDIYCINVQSIVAASGPDGSSGIGKDYDDTVTPDAAQYRSNLWSDYELQ